MSQMTNQTRLSVSALESRDVPAAGLDDLFDPTRYLQLNPDVSAAVAAGTIGAEDHFRRFGSREGRQPGGFFDPRVYLDDNPDVRDAVERGIVRSAVDHFLSNGQFEGRNPNRTFDTAAFLAANPDVAAAVRAGQLTAYQHFVEHGQFEDRRVGSAFDVRVYLDDNPDVRTAVSQGVLRSGTQHFVNFGRFEGRSKPITTVGSITQTTTTFEGTSASSDDKKYFSFSIPATRSMRVDLARVGGDFAKLEIENQATSADVLELEPQNGTNSGTVTLTGGTTYLLRVRAAKDSPAQFRVTLTQL
jgi:hypothetical protein